ncbi:hypothetical protein VXS06_14605 [Photobacterium toruni]|uniref:Ogr/Delta-like zinc finger n=1 Tax=Photobacterium toruni TaxID=1935446 RepID=A0ABU6L8W4_9GAMM|nr:hypothetical protein [Photobacterium toruni]
MKSKLIKPHCPICGCTTTWTDIVISSTSSEPSSLMGGTTTRMDYSCDASFDVCTLALNIYNQYVHSQRIPNRVTFESTDWRDGIKRYNHYIDFITDNKLKEKLMIYADDKLCVKNPPMHLFDV